MKKKIITLFSFIFLSFSMLTGCGGFIEEENLAIESIKTQVLDDGSTEVKIIYNDEDVEPIVFIIPKGEKGETGAAGNGIDSITYTTNELNGTIDLVITFTDNSLEPIKLTLTNGVSVKSIEQVKDENNKNIGFIVHYSDGTSSDLYEVPMGQDGEDGVGISSYRQEFNEDGSSVLTFLFTNGKKYECQIAAPQKGEPGRGISAAVSSVEGEFYCITFKYTDGTEETIEFPMPKGPVEWSSGSGRPQDELGEEGDFYFDTLNKVIYKKTSNIWVPIVTFEESYVVSFDLNAEDAYFLEEFGHVSEYIIKGGNTFYSSNKQVPIPIRPGYTFKGWYTTENPSYVHGAFTDLTVVNSDMILYAKWEIKA